MKYCVAIYMGPMSEDIEAIDKETALAYFKSNIVKQWEATLHEHLKNLTIDNVHKLIDQT